MRKILYFVSLAAAFVISSCGEVTPDNTEKMKVSVTAGTADVTELTFTVSSENVTSCAWMCVEDGTTVPSGTDIMSKGKSTFSNTEAQVKATGLKDNTTYVIVAAGMDEDGEVATSAPVRMTTLVKPAEPAVTITDGKVDGSTYTFKVNPADAQKCAYKLYRKNENATADDVLSTGTEVPATEVTTVTLENLEDGEYFVVAAVQHEQKKAMSLKSSFLINNALPTYTINPTRVYRSYVSTNGDDHIVRFNFIDNVGNTSNIALDFVLSGRHDYVPAGTYQFGAESAPKLDPTYTTQNIYEQADGTFESGYCNVVIKDGKYIFDISLLRSEDGSDYSGHVLTLTWTGDVEQMPII